VTKWSSPRGLPSGAATSTGDDVGLAVRLPERCGNDRTSTARGEALPLSAESGRLQISFFLVQIVSRFLFF
jgi:hypothetical protein